MQITINGYSHELSHPELTYEKLVILSEHVGTPSMTYQGTAQSKWQSGILHAGESLVCREGTRINVSHTGNA